MTMELKRIGNGMVLLPGFADVHVHLREPGFSYKETIYGGSRAAARGGYTAVCTMPNLQPAPDCPAALEVQLELIRRDAVIPVLPFGTITKGQKGKEAAELEALAPQVCGFSDDGFGVADGGLMKEAMERARALGKIIAAHCEDTRYAPEDPSSEWREVERDLQLALDTRCALHLCHLSSAVSLELLRQARKDGADVTCETAPHYLLLDETLRRDSGNWKMNPPLRSPKDREALLAGLMDGTVDMIATDHAPHSAEEKSRGFAGSLNGIVGLECAFAVLYTGLVEPGLLTLEGLCALMSENPRRRFGLPEASFTLFELEKSYVLEPEEFLSQGRSTPFAGSTLRGRCLLTLWEGKPVWREAGLSEALEEEVLDIIAHS